MFELNKTKEVEELIAVTKSDSGISGPELAKAHIRLGELLAENIDIEPEDTTVVALLRGGIFFAQGIYFKLGCKKIKAQLRRVGYEIEPKEQNARVFGVLQNRRRMIIVGWKKGTNFSYPKFQDRTSDALVEDLLNDLPKLVPGGGKDISDYRSGEYSDYLRTMKLRSDDDVLTLHKARPNKERDIEIYKKAIEAWNDGKGSRLNYNSLPEELKTHKNRHSFVDRFKVVEGKDHYCHTMLAHISKDGHYFIHPDIEQHRSITVREAARIQSFPDNYFFEGPRTAQFVQIGNAVPPLMAKGIAEGILTVRIILRKMVLILIAILRSL